MITLVLGGTRSGKSAVAESIAAATGESVTYVATADVDPTDADHVARVAAHRARRPAGWRTVELTEGRTDRQAAPGAPSTTSLAAQVADITGTVLVDSLGTWLTRHHDFEVDASELVAALVGRAGSTVVVSEEVGLAVHPPSELGRHYVDALGALNQEVAAAADRVVLVVAGRILELGRP